MRLISKRILLERAAAYPDAKTALQVWLDVVRTASWYSLEDIRTAFPSADMVGKKLAIFNIRGGHYRLIARVEFLAQRIYVKEFLTHAEYDRKGWMKWLSSTISLMPGSLPTHCPG